MTDFIKEITSWVTTGGQSGDIADYPDNIRNFIDMEFENFGALYTDPSQIPAEFEPRSAIFSNPYDLSVYLAAGTLLLISGDEATPNPIVAILRRPIGFDEEETYEYQVYIGPSGA